MSRVTQSSINNVHSRPAHPANKGQMEKIFILFIFYAAYGGLVDYEQQIYWIKNLDGVKD